MSEKLEFLIEDGVVKGVSPRHPFTMEIPEGVTAIGNRAFQGNSLLKSVRIPDSVTWKS